MIEVKSKIGKRFSVIIPKEIREKLGLKEGDIIVIKKKESDIVISPEKISPFKKLANLLGTIPYNEKVEEATEKFLVKLIGAEKSGDHWYRIFICFKWDGSQIPRKKDLLEKKRTNLKIPSVAIFEYILVLLLKNTSNETIIEALSVLTDIFNEYNLQILKLDISQLIEGLKLRSAYKFGFFDCLIAGTALASKELLIGDDKIFGEIKELPWQDYQSFITS